MSEIRALELVQRLAKNQEEMMAYIAKLEARIAALELREHYQKHGNVNPKIYGPVISDGWIPLS